MENEEYIEDYESTKNVYVVSHKDKRLFCLETFTLTDIVLEDYEDPGTLTRKNEDGSWEYIYSLTDSLRQQLTDDPELIKVLNEFIKEIPEGSTYYEVAWWCTDYNPFVGGFCNRWLEV